MHFFAMSLVPSPDTVSYSEVARCVQEYLNTIPDQLTPSGKAHLEEMYEAVAQWKKNGQFRPLHWYVGAYVKLMLYVRLAPAPKDSRLTRVTWQGDYLCPKALGASNPSTRRQLSGRSA